MYIRNIIELQGSNKWNLNSKTSVHSWTFQTNKYSIIYWYPLRIFFFTFKTEIIGNISTFIDNLFWHTWRWLLTSNNLIESILIWNYLRSIALWQNLQFDIPISNSFVIMIWTLDALTIWYIFLVWLLFFIWVFLIIEIVFTFHWMLWSAQ